MKCMVLFQYSICDMNFGIMESDLILGILSPFIKFLAMNYSSSIRLGVRSRCLPKKKDLARIELTFLQEV